MKGAWSRWLIEHYGIPEPTRSLWNLDPWLNKGNFFCQSGVLNEPDTSQYTRINNTQCVCLLAGWPEFNPCPGEHQLCLSAFEQLRLWLCTSSGKAFPPQDQIVKREFTDKRSTHTNKKRERERKKILPWWETSAASRTSSMWHLPATQRTTECHTATQGTLWVLK